MGISFEGSFVALTTPFDTRGRIDVKALQALVHWHVEQGSDGIICSGTTGEASTLSDADRKKVLEVCVNAAEKQIWVVAGTGTSDTKQTVRLTQMAQKVGADGCLVVAPYYNKPSQKGCILHYQAVSCVELPFIVYNNPGRSVIQLQPETIAEIALLPFASALKESTNDPTFLRKIRELTSLPILAGEDSLTLEMIKEGASGAVSVIGNAIPRQWKRMIQAARAGKWKLAKEYMNRYQPLIRALGKETNPVGIKAVLAKMGRCKLKLRLPLTNPETAVQEEINRELILLGLPMLYRPVASSESV